jgi:hypothetical protein
LKAKSSHYFLVPQNTLIYTGFTEAIAQSDGFGATPSVISS